jgi:branched-chain amino acid transport system ATP-binding protein
MTIVLVEQNARMALATADFGYVLETGTVRMKDRALALLESPFVQDAYLGGA